MKLYLMIFVLLFSCKTGDKINGVRSEFSFEAPNIRVEKFPETFNLKGKGAVRCAEQNCSQEETKPEKLKTLPKHGKWEEFVEREIANGKKISFTLRIGQYADNERTGPWEEYAVKEETKSKIFYEVLDRAGKYESGKREGVWEFYFDEGPNVKKGPVLRKSTYKKDLKHGPEQRFTKDGKLLEESNYVEDKLDGKYIKRTSAGDIEQEGQYSMDKKMGEWREYQFNDTSKKMVLRSIINYLDDKKHGLQILYNPDGRTKRAEGSFANGLETGPWKYFYDNGNIQMQGNFRPVEFNDTPAKDEPTAKDTTNAKPRARRIGPWKRFYKSGGMFAEGDMDGKPVGEWKYYHKNGKLAARGIMRNEFMIDQGSLFEVTGNLLAEGKFMISLIKLDEKTDELQLTYKPSTPFVFYRNGVKYLEMTTEQESGMNVALMFEGGAQIGKGPIEVMTQKKNGCWTINGKKTYFLMDKVVTGAMAKMQKCE